MRELIGEIFDSLNRNRLRTFLTGFSVAWGIFMLIILIGAGNGLKHGILGNFENAGLTNNSMSIAPYRTSIPYKGFKTGRRIELDKETLDFLQNNIEQIEQVSPMLYCNGKMKYSNIFSEISVCGIPPSYAKLTGLKISRGRNINQSDIEQRRNVVILNEIAAKTFFGKHDPIAKTVEIDNIIYSVIGVVKSPWTGNQPTCYLPLSSFMKLYVRNDKFNNIKAMITGVNSLSQAETLNKEVRNRLARQLEFSPNDRSAVRIWNTVESYLQFRMVSTGISIFIWIIGLGTLMAGIVGVSNIMLVTVRERTSEFGIRKSLGAKPSSLVRMVLLESVIITALFGYIGMICGVGVMEIVNLVIERNIALSRSEFVIFQNPTLDLSVMLSATITLITAGIVAGYIPARRAAKLKTIDAMRHNQ